MVGTLIWHFTVISILVYCVATEQAVYNVSRSDVSTIEQIVYCVAQPLMKLSIMYFAAMYLPLHKLFIVWLSHLTNCLLCISQWCIYHWTNVLLCISQRCIYHWTNYFLCGSGTEKTVYYVSCSDVSTIEQIVYFVAQPLNKLFIIRRMAENGFAPPPLANFADISYLVENWKPSLLRDVCTLCSGALVCKSL